MIVLMLNILLFHLCPRPMAQNLVNMEEIYYRYEEINFILF